MYTYLHGDWGLRQFCGSSFITYQKFAEMSFIYPQLPSVKHLNNMNIWNCLNDFLMGSIFWDNWLIYLNLAVFYQQRMYKPSTITSSNYSLSQMNSWYQTTPKYTTVSSMYKIDILAKSSCRPSVVNPDEFSSSEMSSWYLKNFIMLSKYLKINLFF